MEIRRLFWGRKIEERSAKVIERMAKKGFSVKQTITNRFFEDSKVITKTIIFEK